MRYTNGVEARVGDTVIDADGVVGKLVEIAPNGEVGNVLRMRTVPLKACTRVVDVQDLATPLRPGPSVRAKFFVRLMSPKDAEGKCSVTLSAVYGVSEENKRFFSLTPAGEIGLGILNPEAVKAFELGKEYYVDFTPVEAPVISPPITMNTICVGGSPAPAQPPIDNAHVAEGCEKFSEPAKG
jgi:hypothetical protein